jgi:hypothetical protein
MANTQWDGTDGRVDDGSADRPDRAAPLEPGQGTVGSHIDIRHLAATPIGMRVTSRATLTERDGRRREGVDHVGVRGHRHLGTHGQRHLRDPLLGVPAHGRGTDQCARRGSARTLSHPSAVTECRGEVHVLVIRDGGRLGRLSSRLRSALGRSWRRL